MFRFIFIFCMCTITVPGTQGCQKRVSDAVKLKSQRDVVGLGGGAGAASEKQKVTGWKEDKSGLIANKQLTEDKASC